MNHTQRKARSDATVNLMIRQYCGLTEWSSSLSAVFHGKSLSDRRRFFYECKKAGLEVENG